jgi:Ser/Thr protein kinase RdoA (MazF antagonist)
MKRANQAKALKQTRKDHEGKAPQSRATRQRRRKGAVEGILTRCERRESNGILHIRLRLVHADSDRDNVLPRGQSQHLHQEEGR